MGVLSLLITLSGSFFSCDVLEPDADVLEPQVSLGESDVYVLSNGLAFIDLNTKVKTNAPVRLSVTSSTRYGELSDLGKGLFQYVPAPGNAKVRDAFEFTVYSEMNTVVKKDTITIIVENDSTQLPCGIYPSNDYVYGVEEHVASSVDVLANDYICGYDSAGLVVAIYRPDDTFPPYHGSAQVVGHKIIYTPDSSFAGSDQLIYKVYPVEHPDSVSYGVVYFKGVQSCDFSLEDDMFVVDQDSLSNAHLPVLANDSLCYPQHYQLNVAQHPRYGTAVVSGDGFTYTVADTVAVSPSFNDHFLYEVCAGAQCKTARVDLRVE